ncbi:hypothetical protein [Sphingomonas sp. BAUL-RG-20F-R05-02]|uniref:hypothetical protein n=1 Tax=Sphingomonas sp. BAUL-RG-20F-R05-02 TaxID=2914830 RepID=UPI001F55B674|nr:hypothetical protein [Sphingomonas sp. BAUL-RG-20F-R05-02]
MTDQIETIPTSLLFEGKPIAIVTFEDGGVPYFALDDLCDAIGWSKEVAAAKVQSYLFPAHGKRIAQEATEDGIVNVTVLSPVGVFYLADLIDAPKGQRLTAWAKREARKLCPNASESDPAMFLTLSPGRRRPPRPMRYSGWLAEWLVLKATTNALGAHNPGRELQELALERAWEARAEQLKAAREAKGEVA